jgi:hypothetical protein
MQCDHKFEEIKLRVQQYLKAKQESKVQQYSITKQQHLESHVLQFDFNLFFVGMY